MRKLQSILPDTFDAQEVVRTARAQRVLREWPEIVGKHLAARSRPERVDRGVVWIAVEGSAWAQELRMMRDVILDRLRSRAGDASLFKDLRFGVRPLPLPEDVPAEADAKVEDISELTIREIAERRLARWNENGSDSRPA